MTSEDKEMQGKPLQVVPAIDLLGDGHTMSQTTTQTAGGSDDFVKEQSLNDGSEEPVVLATDQTYWENAQKMLQLTMPAIFS